MTTRGQLYVIEAPRKDGGFIVFRTTDRAEADRMAATLGTPWSLA